MSDARVAHIGVAVADLDEAVAFYRDVLGLAPSAPKTANGTQIVSVPMGDVEVELLTSEAAGTPIAKFLAKRGPGIHHICYRVPNLDRALQACRDRGYRVIDESPRLGVHGRRIAFLHPESTARILVELTE